MPPQSLGVINLPAYLTTLGIKRTESPMHKKNAQQAMHHHAQYNDCHKESFTLSMTRQAIYMEIK